MKKFILVISLSLFALNSYSQFHISTGVGIPTGDIKDFSSYQINLGATYMLESESDFKVGLSTSYVRFFGKKDADYANEDYEDLSWFPLAAVINYSLSDNFSIGTKVGYAIGVYPDYLEGGFYLLPNIGYSISDKIALKMSYSMISISSGTDSSGYEYASSSISNIGLEVAFQL